MKQFLSRRIGRQVPPVGLLALVALVPIDAHAQSRAAVAQKAPPRVSAGPTLEETRAWIATDMRPLAWTNDSRRSVSRYGTTTTMTRIVASNIRLEGCTLRYTHDRNTMTFYDTQRTERRSSSDHEVPMGDIDMASIVVKDPWKLDQEEWTSRPIEISMRTRRAAGETIVSRSHQGISGIPGYPPRAPNESYREAYASLPAQDASSAERIMRALTRAAELCGSTRSAF